MFEVGFWELGLCLAIALVVLGPEKLPGLVRTLGRWTGQARSYVRNLTNELERETRKSGLKQELQNVQRDLREQARGAQDALKQLGDVDKRGD